MPTPARTSPPRAAGRPSARIASITSRSIRAASTRTRPPAGAFRGYAATQAVWASEQCVDLLAERLGADPLELRLRNVLRDGDRFATGEMMHDFHVAECLERVAERIGWSAGKRGKGLCAVMKGMQTPSRSEARIVLDGGRFTVESATTDIGQGRDQSLRQLAACSLGCDASIIDTAGVDTDSSPFDTRTTSSRSAHMMAGAIGNAARELRRRIADELEANPADVLFVGDAVEIVGSPGTRRALSTFGSLQGSGEWVLDGGLDPDTGQGIASAHWHQGAAAIEVRVDDRDRRDGDREPRGRGLRGPRRRRLGRRAPE